MRISFSDGLAVCGILATIVLVALDKGGKLRGPLPVVLLALAALITLPLALGNPWVSNADGMLKFARGMFMVFAVGIIYSALAVWISTDEDSRSSEPPIPVPAPAPVPAKTVEPPAPPTARHGASPATQPPVHDPKKTITLYRLFKESVQGITSVDFRPVQISIAASSDDVIGIEPRLNVDFVGGSKFVSFFVPSSSKSELTKDVCLFIAEHYADLRMTALKTLDLISTKPGERPSSTATMPFTGRIILYHEDPLSFSNLALIEQYYKEHSLTAIFRGTEYLQAQILERQLDKNKATAYTTAEKMPAPTDKTGIIGISGGVSGQQMQIVMHEPR